MINELKKRVERQFSKLESQRDVVPEVPLPNSGTMVNIKSARSSKFHAPLVEELKEEPTKKVVNEQFSLQQMDSLRPLQLENSRRTRRGSLFAHKMSASSKQDKPEDDDLERIFAASADPGGNSLDVEISRQSCVNHCKNFFFVILMASLVSCYFVGVLVMTRDFENKRQKTIDVFELIH